VEILIQEIVRIVSLNVSGHVIGASILLRGGKVRISGDDAMIRDALGHVLLTIFLTTGDLK
jgi:hypothetical protein